MKINKNNFILRLFSILIVICFCTLVSCDLNNTKVPDDLEFVKTAIDNTNNVTNLYGLEYQKKQTIDNEVVYEKHTFTKVIDYENKKARMDFYEKELSDFSLTGEKYLEKNYSIIYNNSVNTIRSNGEEKEITEEFKAVEFNVNLLDLINTKSIIDYVVSSNVVKININNDKANEFFSLDNITNFSMNIIISNDLISSIEFNYTIDSSSFDIIYALTYVAYSEAIYND